MSERRGPGRIHTLRLTQAVDVEWMRRRLVNRGATARLRRGMELPWWLPFGRVAEIDPSELSLALANGAAPQLVDVRSAAEFAEGHIAGAVNVPMLQLCSRLDEARLDRKRAVVAICLSGHRSVPAVRRLAEAGFEAKHLQGGMLAWRRAGLPEKGR